MANRHSDTSVNPTNASWYHGKVSQDEAKKLLVEDGDFLVRKSCKKDKYYVLAMWNSKKFKTLIPQVKGGWKYDNQILETIDEWINFHLTSQTPIDAKGALLKYSIEIQKFARQESKTSTCSTSSKHSTHSADNRDPYTLLRTSLQSNLIDASSEINTYEEIINEPWYHGALTREQAEQLVIRDGDFLVRKSNHINNYVVTTFWNSHKVNYEIPRLEEGFKYYERIIPTIDEWVKVQQESGKPISAELGGYLRNPIHKKCENSSNVNPSVLVEIPPTTRIPSAPASPIDAANASSNFTKPQKNSQIVSPMNSSRRLDSQISQKSESMQNIHISDITQFPDPTCNQKNRSAESAVLTTSMSAEHRRILKHYGPELVRDLQLGPEFLATLMRDDIITSNTKELIMAEKTRGQRVSKLLDILPTRGANAFDTFKEALREDSQDVLAKMLDRSFQQRISNNSATESDDIDTMNGQLV